MAHHYLDTVFTDGMQTTKRDQQDIQYRGARHGMDRTIKIIRLNTPLSDTEHAVSVSGIATVCLACR